MTVRFVDTNIVIYAISNDEREREKALRAREILSQTRLALSVQVLQEFYVQSTRRSRPGALSHERAMVMVEALLRFPVVDLSVALVQRAIATHVRFQISYWDAAILEAARGLGCEIVLSEDLNDGQDYDGVSVENPFAS